MIIVMAVLIGSTAVAGPATAAPSGDVDHVAPVDAPIVDHFRPPPEPWMAGNRGIDYGTGVGVDVHPSAPGRVIFAGQVGGQLHVTVEHSDGLRTTYSFLASISVSAGDRVRVGDVLGVTGGAFHFGVRTPDGEYLDPEAVIAGTARAHILLVPGTDDGLDALGASERRSLLSTLLDDGTAAIAAAASWTSATASLMAHYIVETDATIHVARMVDAFGRWLDQRDGCTAPGAAVPAPAGRRIVVLVSGLGTASGGNSAWEVDTGSLGYDSADVVRFSYAGGRSPSDATAGELASIPAREFTSADSQQSIEDSSDRLQGLLQQVSAAAPDVPIDVVAHSQGGVVARLAIERAAADGRLPGAVGNLVTLGSPHQGAPLATGVEALGMSHNGSSALHMVRESGAAGELDERRPAIDALAENSPVIAELHARPMPDSVRFTTLGASGDTVVPGTAALDPAADGAVILPSAIGNDAHGELPSRPETTREVGLALAGMAPTCQSMATAMAAAATAEGIRWAETSASAAGAATMVMSPSVLMPR